MSVELTVGIADLVISVLGFGLAIWEIRKAKTAAEAAKAAAEAALNQVRTVQAVANIQHVCSRSRELLTAVKSKPLPPAAVAALELREAVSRFGITSTALKLESPEFWQSSLATLKSIHDRLETSAQVNRIDTEEKNALISDVSNIHMSLTALASSAETSGAFNANSN